MMKKRINIIYWSLGIISILLMNFLGNVFAAETSRGLVLDGMSVSDSQGQEVLLYNESHALILGNINYDYWPILPGVQRDVSEVEQILKLHGFNVVVETDLDKISLDDAFNNFISSYGQNPENRLLFYFAGHGHTVKMNYGEELGYIVPIDAPNPNDDLPGFQTKAMDMQRIEIYAKRIQAKHAIFLFDACFSGSLFALSRAVPGVISYKTANPVRQFITSGSADETVPDESIFRAQFIRALTGDADGDGNGYVTGTELGEFLQNTVVNYSYNSQHPQYGKIRNPNLDKGDFVFNIPEEPIPESISTFITPPEITSDFDDIEAQLQWQEYLEKMEETSSKLGRYEELNVSVESKVTAWKRFLDTFSEDDPYSNRDEELRTIAQERVVFWDSRSFSAPVETPSIDSAPIFRISDILIKDARGMVLQPIDEIYSIKLGESVTITVDIEHPPTHQIEAIWISRNGNILTTPEITNTYTPQKIGPDYVVVQILDGETGDVVEEPLGFVVIP